MEVSTEVETTITLTIKMTRHEAKLLMDDLGKQSGETYPLYHALSKLGF